jgi:hypothetical protein
VFYETNVTWNTVRLALSIHIGLVVETDLKGSIHQAQGHVG